MERIRVFVAVDLSEHVLEKVRAHVDHLKTDISAGIDWVNATSMHMTLVFIGNVETQRIPAICQAINGATDSICPFRVWFNEIGAFPNINKPRVIWLGMQHVPSELISLHAKIIEELRSVNFLIETRPRFTPHITVGRIIKRAHRDIYGANIGQVLENYELSDGIPAGIDKVRLFSSDIGKAGVVYSPIYTRLLSDM